MGVAENIDALLVSRDMTQERLAEIADVDKSTVSNWRTRGRRPRDEAVKKLCAYFGLTPDDILSDRYGLAAKAHGRFGIPVYSSGEATVPLVTLGRVHAGPLTEEETVELRVDIPAPVFRAHPRAAALIVEGGCMDNVVLDGMAVVFDPDLTPGNGSVTIVETPDHEAVMRRWYWRGDTLTLRADSHSGDYEDIVVRWSDGPIRVLGVVVWVQSAEEMV